MGPRNNNKDLRKSAQQAAGKVQADVSKQNFNKAKKDLKNLQSKVDQAQQKPQQKRRYRNNNNRPNTAHEKKGQMISYPISKPHPIGNSISNYQSGWIKNPSKKETPKQILAPYELFRLAQHFPGSVDAPYCKGVEVTSMATKTMRIEHLLETCDNVGVGTGQIGINRYVVMFMCPSLSLYKSSNTAVGKNSGMYILSVDNLNQTFSPCAVDSATQAINWFSVFKDDGITYIDNLFAWSMEFAGEIQCQQAAIAGTVHYGALPLSSFMLDSVSQQNLNPVTVSILIKQAGYQESLKATKGRFALQNAIMNTNIPFTLYNNTAANLFSNEFQGEVISYIVLDRAVQPTAIASGSQIPLPPSQPYTLAATISVNLGYFPRADNALSARMVQATQTRPVVKAGKSVDITQMPYHPTVGAPNWMNTRFPGLGKAWDWIEQKYRDYKPYVDMGVSIARTVGPLLAVNNPSIKKDDDDELIVSTDMMRSRLLNLIILTQTLELIYPKQLDIYTRDYQYVQKIDVPYFKASELPSRMLQQPQSNKKVESRQEVNYIGTPGQITRF